MIFFFSIFCFSCQKVANQRKVDLVKAWMMTANQNPLLNRGILGELKLMTRLRRTKEGNERYRALDKLNIGGLWWMGTLRSFTTIFTKEYNVSDLTLSHSERPKLSTILAFLSAIGLNVCFPVGQNSSQIGSILDGKNVFLKKKIFTLDLTCRAA